MTTTTTNDAGRREALATTYKRAVAGRYRALTRDDLGEVPAGRTWVSPKIDGELWFAELSADGVTLFARGGRTLAEAPVVDELRSAAKGLKERIVVAGELFAAGRKPRPRVGDVAAALADDSRDRLGFHAFDVVAVDDAPPPVGYGERLALLSRVITGGKRAAVVRTEEAVGAGAIVERFDDWVGSGRAEGLIARAESGMVFKIKPRLTVDVVVVAFTTRVDAPDMVRSLLLGFVRPDGAIQLAGAVGNLAGDDMRRSLLQTLTACECPSRFRQASSDGSLYRFVRPELVVEVACTDVQSEDSAGERVKQWTLQHDGAGWAPVCPINAASLLHPSLVRVRDDKRADGLDARVAQLEERLPANETTAEARAVSLPKSEVVRREAWVKDTKGKTAVRKLLVWRTNKDAVVAGWPAWVVHFTDYSPDRKTPLERTLRTARTEDEAAAVAAALIEENIKRGWEPYASTTSAPMVSSEPVDKSEPELAPKKKRAPKAPSSLHEDESLTDAAPTVKKKRARKATAP
jgi:hypothetical protein